MSAPRLGSPANAFPPRRERREHELHAVQVVRRIGHVPAEVDAGHPLGAGCDADAAARRAPSPSCAYRGPAGRPATGCRSTGRTRSRRRRDSSRSAPDVRGPRRCPSRRSRCPGRCRRSPIPSGRLDQRDVPLRAGRRRAVAVIGAAGRRDRPQPRIEQHAIDVAAAGQPDPGLHAVVDQDAVEQVVRRERQVVRGSARRAAAPGCDRRTRSGRRTRRRAVCGRRTGRRRPAQVGLLLHHHEQLLAEESGMPGERVDDDAPPAATRRQRDRRRRHRRPDAGRSSGTRSVPVDRTATPADQATIASSARSPSEQSAPISAQ